MIVLVLIAVEVEVEPLTVVLNNIVVVEVMTFTFLDCVIASTGDVVVSDTAM